MKSVVLLGVAVAFYSFSANAQTCANVKDRVEGGATNVQYSFNAMFDKKGGKDQVKICINPTEINGKIINFKAEVVGSATTPTHETLMEFFADTDSTGHCAIVGCSEADAYKNCSGYAQAIAKECF